MYVGSILLIQHRIMIYPTRYSTIIWLAYVYIYSIICTKIYDYMHITRYENRCRITCHSSPGSNLSEALWYDLRDLELKLTWGTENWPYGRTLKNKLGSCMFKINITRNVPSDLSEVLCLAWFYCFWFGMPGQSQRKSHCHAEICDLCARQGHSAAFSGQRVSMSKRPRLEYPSLILARVELARCWSLRLAKTWIICCSTS